MDLEIVVDGRLLGATVRRVADGRRFEVGAFNHATQMYTLTPQQPRGWGPGPGPGCNPRPVGVGGELLASDDWMLEQPAPEAAR